MNKVGRDDLMQYWRKITGYNMEVGGLEAARVFGRIL